MRNIVRIFLTVLVVTIMILLLSVPTLVSSEGPIPTAEPTPKPIRDEDIGYMYFKDPEEDDVVYDGAGVYFVKNQILISAGGNLAFKDVSAIASQYNAKIVGYFEFINEYQIEIQTDVTTEELYQIIADLKENPDLLSVSLNTVSNITADTSTAQTRTYYETPESTISLDGYQPYAIMYLSYGGDYNSTYGNVSGVILYSDGRTISYKCPSDLAVMYVDLNELVSDPESISTIKSLQSPDRGTVDDNFSLLNEVNPNAPTKITEDIPTSEGVVEESPKAEYQLWGYYVNSEGEYQSLALDTKGYAISSLEDANAEKICKWFFEQQSQWGFQTYSS
jgi:hypothetical protein